MDNTTINPVSAPLAHLVDLFCFKGRPHNIDPDREVQVLVNHGYVTGFSSARKQPVWTAYRVTSWKQDVDFSRPHLFYDDERLEAEDRIGTWTFGKYGNTSYDRGHMVPNNAINHQFGRLAQMETFFMSNICPQRSDTNQGIWMKLEHAIIFDYARTWDHIWVLTGPIFSSAPRYLTRSTGARVPIPRSFYCILIDPFKWPHDKIDNVDILALEISQGAGREKLAKKHITTIKAIEEKTKLDFLPRLTAGERAKVESKKAKDIWDARIEG